MTVNDDIAGLGVVSFFSGDFCFGSVFQYLEKKVKNGFVFLIF